MQCKFNKNWAGFSLILSKQVYFSDFEREGCMQRHRANRESTNIFSAPPSPLRDISLHYSQLRIIQHNLLFAIQLKVNSCYRVMCCTFHFHHLAKTKFLMLYFLSGL
jgi:hypothetical protein